MTTRPRVMVIDYGVGNTASVIKVFRSMGAEVIFSSAPEAVQEASHIVLPGVGAFGKGMEQLVATGLIPYLTERVIEHKVPFLGICLGMQLLAEQGFEYGPHRGLGWIAGDVVKLEGRARLPHIGWNDITIVNESPLLAAVPDSNFYFVHSYHFACSDNSAVRATCEYGQTFTAVVQKENIFGTQFHPEKSQAAGIRILKNFLGYA